MRDASNWKRTGGTVTTLSRSQHATRRARALLCSGCNAGLGLFKVKPELLRAATYT
ncbi:MAG: endonuclease VII domain-containing protein [Actinomycetota bacterium]|nr:endonuclease VII domain-containing protein [Actinomycetota bacterium]